MTISYDGVTLNMDTLFTAATTFHRAVRQAVDPIAAAEVHEQPPFIDLGD